VLLAVGYHYVVERAPDEPRAIFPVTTDSLAAQVELLGRSFEPVSRDDLLAAVAGERELPERACVLTFDDGLRCQVELALPILERVGVPAIFFIPGGPLGERRALSVHKVHALRERLGDPDFEARLHDVLEAHGTEVPDISAEQAKDHYRYDNEAAARMKFLLNMALPPEARDAIVHELFQREVADERAFADQLYMTREQVAELEVEHRAVGAHSYRHQPLALLPDDELDRDLEQVSALLHEVTGVRPRAFSYPHGTPSTVDLRTARRVEAAGYRVAFTSERALNRTLDEPLLLARLDANDAPGGARAGVGIEPARERYLRESKAGG
jgi:peptidoglycan/xylan/chitin deacetylase (PgdA/CDA1 family)